MIANQIATRTRAPPERTADGRWVIKCDPETIRELVVNQGKSVRETARFLAQPFSTVQGICQRRGWKPGQGSQEENSLVRGYDPRSVTMDAVVKPEVAHPLFQLAHPSGVEPETVVVKNPSKP